MRYIFCPVSLDSNTNKIEQIIKFKEVGTHKWIVPEGIKKVDVFLVGGGGGGSHSGGGYGYTKAFRSTGYVAPQNGT